jgi:tetratricopeptide (TPR) repeat protein
MEQAAAKAVQAAPSATRYSRLANVYASRPTPDLALAATNYENAVKADAENGGAWLELAQIRLSLNDLAGAVVAADKAAGILKTPDARLLALRARVEQTPLDPSAVETARALTNELAGDLQHAQAQALMGAALLLSGSEKEAVDCFARAEPKLRDDPDFQYWYGLALLKQKNENGAKAHFKSAIDCAGRAPQNSLQARVQPKALGEMLKLDPNYQAALPEPGRIIEASNSKDTTKAGDRPAIRKVLPPVIEDDGPTPIPTELPRPR